MRPWRAGLTLVLLCAVGCGSRTRTTWGPTDSHASAEDAGPPASKIERVSGAEAQTRYRAALARDDLFEAVVYANRYAAGGDALPEDDAAAILVAVDQLDADLLLAAWDDMDAKAAPAGWLAYRLALVADHRGDTAAAAQWLERIPATSAARPRGDALADTLAKSARVAPTVVAVLLPLSGRFESIGRELQSGIELAGARDGAVSLVFLDTQGEPAGARAAVDAAVYEHGAIAILGPVGQLTGRAAATRAVERGIPLAMLSPGRGGAAPRAGVFRMWPSAVWIADAAARVAVQRGFDALAVLAPRDEYGAATTRAFTAAAVAAGARVVSVGEYDPTATELEPDLKEFLNLVPARNERYRKHLRAAGDKHAWKTFSPDVPFDLLYVPDDYQRAALVASYLPFFNVEVRTSDLMDPLELRRKHGGRLPSFVQLMGSPGWHHPGLFARGGPSVEGALIVDVCAGGESEEFATNHAAEFHEVFRRRYRRSPTPTAAQAYDAALLVLAARRVAAAKSDAPRERMTRALGQASIDDGACGRASMSPSGEIERDPVVLRVDAGEFLVEQ